MRFPLAYFLLLLGASIVSSPVFGDTTYTTQTGNFTLQTATPSGFASDYNSGSSLGLYANGGSAGSSPMAVAFRSFTTSGATGSTTALPLQVGESITISFGLNGTDKGINGNSIGFSLNNGTASSSVTNYNTGGRFEYSYTGGQTSAAVYDGSGSGPHTSGLPGFSAFAGGLTYTVTLVSTNEYNFTVSGGGATYNINSLGGTSGSTIDSFSLFNRGYNNNDAIFSAITVTDLAAINLTANTSETKNVTGVIKNNSATGTNSINKLGVGTVVLQAANTFVGSTTVSAGTLQLNAAGALSATSGVSISNGGTLSLTASSSLATPVATTGTTGSPMSVSGAIPISLAAGSILSRNGSGVSLGSHSGVSGTVGIGTLTMSGAATLDFGTTGVGTLNFNGFSDAGNNALSVLDYSRTTSVNTAGVDNTDDRLIFNQRLTSAQLADITFGGTASQEIALANGEYEIVPVPEPATCFGGLLLAGAAGYGQRRRLCSRRPVA